MQDTIYDLNTPQHRVALPKQRLPQSGIQSPCLRSLSPQSYPLPYVSNASRSGETTGLNFTGEPGEYLLRCCGGDRLRKKKVSLLVKASGNLGILTIHDYLSAVHPWLMGLREEILQASGDLLDHVPLSADTRLMVSHPGLPELDF